MHEAWKEETASRESSAGKAGLNVIVKKQGEGILTGFVCLKIGFKLYALVKNMMYFQTENLLNK
jgi:hypothetical protein